MLAVPVLRRQREKDLCVSLASKHNLRTLPMTDFASDMMNCIHENL